MNRRLLHILLPALLLSVGAGAQEVAPVSESLTFLAQPRSAHSLGMAGAGNASPNASAAFAAFGNPAILPSGKLDASLSYARWAPGSSLSLSNQMDGGVAVRLGKGFALSGAAVYQMHAAQAFGGKQGAYAPSDLAAGIGIGAAFNEHFSLGVSVRYARQQLLPDYVLSGVAVNALLQYRLRAFTMAAGVMNVGAGPKSESGTGRLPASAHLAADYLFALGANHSIEAALDGDYYFSGKWGVSVGACYSFRRVLFARAGYRAAAVGAALPSHLSLSLGGQWKGVCLDLCYLTANPVLGNSLSLQLGYRF